MFPLLEQIFGGDKLGFGIALLAIIAKNWGKSTEFIYTLIPSKYKEPEGTMTLPEVLTAIEDGIKFYGSITKVFTK